MPPFSIEDALARTAAFPRIRLVDLPTPFRKLDRLTAALGGPEIYIKRDDLTGLAFGGNKSRKLEFIIGDALAKKADVIITWASLQSNWCMQTAAAARMHGIRPILVLFNAQDQPPEYDGNLLLDYILEADIRLRQAAPGKVVKAEEAMGVVEEAAAEVRAQGLKPYLVPVGGSVVMGDMDKPLGAISYVNAYAELLSQALASGLGEPNYVVHSTGSGSTQAGLIVGAKALTESCRVIGISVSDARGPFSEVVSEIVRAAGEALGLGLDIGPEDIIVLDDYIREGYGTVNREVAEVIRFVFQKEGIVLDPVYTAKAMAGLIDLVHKGFFKKRDRVVFLHTGGTPALFPSRRRLVDLLS